MKLKRQQEVNLIQPRLFSDEVIIEPAVQLSAGQKSALLAVMMKLIIEAFEDAKNGGNHVE